MQNKQLILEYFNDKLNGSVWLLDKDTDYAKRYYALYNSIIGYDEMSESDAFELMYKVEALAELYIEKLVDPTSWVAPKTQAANELIHDENGKLTQDSVEL